MKKNIKSYKKNIADKELITRIKLENPDLPVKFIKKILIGLQEARSGKFESYSFQNDNL
jgi:hypothetical protein